MFHKVLCAGALALTAAAPAFAQPAPTGSMTAQQVGVSPLTGTSAANYVKMAADADMYEIESSKLALMRGQSPEVKAFAKEMIADHIQTTKSLMGALKTPQRTIPKPPAKLSADNAAKIALLKKAPKAKFDSLYMQQQATAHQTAWALHSGYAMDGTDPALKQVATTAVPVIEKHLAHVKQMTPSGASSMM